MRYPPYPDCASTDPADPTEAWPPRTRPGCPAGDRARGVATPLSVGPPAPSALPSFRNSQKFKMQSEIALPHCVANYPSHDPDYPWRLDAYRCYLLAIRLKSIAIGATRPSAPSEMYWAEQHGAIP